MIGDKVDELLDFFRKRASVSIRSYRDLKEESSGKELICYTLGDVPRELIHAAHFTPAGIVGWSAPVGKAAAYLPSFCCSLMRTSLDIGIEAEKGLISGLVLGHVCDTTRDFSGIWQRRVEMEFFHDWMPPKQMNKTSAGAYAISELSRLKTSLEEYSGAPISEGELEASLEVYETQRSLLKDLKELYRKVPGLLAGPDLYCVLKASLLTGVEIFNEKVGQLLRWLQATPAPPVFSAKPVVIAGKIPEPAQLLGVIEEAGLFVTDDDFLWGSRIIRNALPSEGPPLKRMADRLLKSEPFPGYLYEGPARGEFLAKLVNMSQAEGVIFWNPQFCEPYNFDYPDLKDLFAKAGIPALFMETEIQPSGIEQLRTRIHAFSERLVQRPKPPLAEIDRL